MKLLKANGGTKVKMQRPKGQEAYQSNCFDFIWDFILNKLHFSVCKISRSHTLDQGFPYKESQANRASLARPAD